MSLAHKSALRVLRELRGGDDGGKFSRRETERACCGLTWCRRLVGDEAVVIFGRAGADVAAAAPRGSLANAWLLCWREEAQEYHARNCKVDTSRKIFPST